MASSDWREKAAFMRDVGATAAVWDLKGRLRSLTLAPAAQPRVVGPASQMIDMQKQVEAAAQRRHDIMFAASSIKPKLDTPPPAPSVVPRAVRAKLEAARRGEANGNR